MLRVFDRYLQNGHIAGWEAIDNALINDFMKSRHRLSPGSYNHLFGVLRRFFAFAIATKTSDDDVFHGELLSSVICASKLRVKV